MIYNFIFPQLPPNANDYARMHWTKRDLALKQWTGLAREAAGEVNFPINEQWVTECHVSWLLFVNRLRDWDNAAAMWKLVGDGLRHAKILKNDSPKVVVSFMVSQQQVSKDDQYCEVVIDATKMARVPDDVIQKVIYTQPRIPAVR